MSIENLPNSIQISFGIQGATKLIYVDGITYSKSQWQNDFGDLDFNDTLIKDEIDKLNLDKGNIGDGSLSSIDWNQDDSSLTRINFATGYPYMFEPNEENYNKYCKPYVDIWQEIKDKIEQEQEAQEKEYNKFENRQKRALTQLNQDFEDVKERAYIKSSLGFTSDADSTANENITGLLLTIGDNTVQYCDYYNEFHELNKSQLTTLQNEIIQNAQNLYTQKWQYRTAIENATDNSSLDEAVSQINFTYMDFSTSQS